MLDFKAKKTPNSISDGGRPARDLYLYLKEPTFKGAEGKGKKWERGEVKKD